MVELTTEAFTEAASIGLGRAIAHVQRTGTVPDDSLVNHLMLHNTAYVPQVEGTRGWYASQLVMASDQAGFYLEAFERALPNAPLDDESDERHRISFLAYLATDGSTGMRRLLYDRTAAHIAAGYDAGLDAIIRIGGAAGVEWLLEQYAQADRDPADLYDKIAIAADSETLLSLPIIQTLRKQKPQAAQGKRSSPAQKQLPATYEGFKGLVDTQPDQMHFGGGARWLKWIERASDEDLRRAATDMLTLPPDDHDRLLAYLAIFARRPFPRDPQPLLDMARSYVGEVAWTPEGLVPELLVPVRALVALKQIEHPNVRAFALEQIDRELALDRALGLLSNNYQPGDWPMISNLVRREHSREVMHGAGLAVLDIFEQHPDDGALPALHFLVEHGPCSRCRFGLMRSMHQLGSLPQPMQTEAHLDSLADTRAWAGSGFTHTGNQRRC